MPPSMASQASENVSYGCTALVGSNKTGALKPIDDAGYYRLVVGAIGCFNSAGAYYVWNEEVKALFDKSSSLMRRVSDGALRGEYGHPRMVPGMRPSDYLARILDIYEPNVCCHIRSLTLDFTNAVIQNNQAIVTIFAEVKPSGAMGPALESSLKNPHENVCFSIRSLVTEASIANCINKTIKQVVTYDYVNEPGISTAKKWNAPGLEEFENRKFTPAQLRLVVDNTRRTGVGLESTHEIATSLAHALGWDHEDPKSPIVLPRESRW